MASIQFLILALDKCAFKECSFIVFFFVGHTVAWKAIYHVKLTPILYKINLTNIKHCGENRVEKSVSSSIQIQNVCK